MGGRCCCCFCCCVLLTKVAICKGVNGCCCKGIGWEATKICCELIDVCC